MHSEGITNYPNMEPEVNKQKIAEGKVHLKLVAKSYRKQYHKGQ